MFEANLETQGERQGGILEGLRSFMVYLGFWLFLFFNLFMYPGFQIEIEILSNLRYFYENIYIKSYNLLVKKFSIKKATIE